MPHFICHLMDLLQKALAPAFAAAVVTLAGTAVVTSLPPNNSFKPTPLRGAA